MNLIFEKRPEMRITGKQLTKLFEFVTLRFYFLFNGNYYDQINNVVMGFPLGHALANLFISYHEKIWSEEFKISEVVLYRWYVDDIICLFACEKDANEFFNLLNSRHPDISSLSKRKKITKQYF